MNDTTTPRILELDPAVLGRSLIALPIGSLRLGHKNLSTSLRHYCTPLTPEVEYICDLFDLTTTEIREKWLGDDGTVEREFAERFAAIIPRRARL